MMAASIRRRRTPFSFLSLSCCFSPFHESTSAEKIS